MPLWHLNSRRKCLLALGRNSSSIRAATAAEELPGHDLCEPFKFRRSQHADAEYALLLAGR
jgi:hypothetical protein